MSGLASGSQRISGIVVPGRTLEPGTNQAQENYVTPGFFETSGLELSQGRSFTDADRRGTQRVAIVSEATARHFFETDNPVGQQFGYGSPDFEVVGVVRDARVNVLREDPRRLIYYPLAQHPQEFITSVEARVTGEPTAVLAGVRTALGAADRNLPVREVAVLQELLTRGLWRERLVARLASAFGLLAWLLAGVGLYGVMAYMVARRTNEVGVRLALGATPGSVRWLVLRDSLMTIAAGVGLGLALSYPLLQFARGLVYGLSPHDPSMAVIATALILAAGTLATIVPAWRASRVDPLKAIRAE
jgi:predicted permease